MIAFVVLAWSKLLLEGARAAADSGANLQVLNMYTSCTLQLAGVPDSGFQFRETRRKGVTRSRWVVNVTGGLRRHELMAWFAGADEKI